MSESKRQDPEPRPRAAVIGAGMGGILATIKLRELDFDVTVFEKADRVGGTWRENTYPGLACDVPAHWYTYSFARNPNWRAVIAPGADLLDYFQRVAVEFGLMPLIRFGEEVVRLEYRDAAWTLETGTGRVERFDLVIAATGVLHHPNRPQFEGLSSFQGACFHSARWDHDVTLDGKRIGVVGTGSTASQIVSALVERTARLDLFQRTPQWVMARPNVLYTDEELAAFRDPSKIEELVERYRTATFEGYATAVVDVDSPQLAQIQRLCEENLATVRDPDLRRRLTPTYRAACKRLVISEDFYNKIQHPNANLVTAPIARIEPEGVRTEDGILHELDVLVLATGFHVDRFIRPTKVIGRDGRDLDQVWKDGPQAYLAVSVAGFPNLFFIGGPNAPVGNFSLIEISERQLAYLKPLLAGLRKGEFGEVAAKAEAMERFEAERRAAAVNTVWVTGCKSWYLDKSGVPASWTFTYNRFLEEMEAPNMADFEIG